MCDRFLPSKPSLGSAKVALAVIQRVHPVQEVGNAHDAVIERGIAPLIDSGPRHAVGPAQATASRLGYRHEPVRRLLSGVQIHALPGGLVGGDESHPHARGADVPVRVHLRCLDSARPGPADARSRAGDVVADHGQHRFLQEAPRRTGGRSGEPGTGRIASCSGCAAADQHCADGQRTRRTSAASSRQTAPLPPAGVLAFRRHLAAPERLRCARSWEVRLGILRRRVVRCSAHYGPPGRRAARCSVIGPRAAGILGPASAGASMP